MKVCRYWSVKREDHRWWFVRCIFERGHAGQHFDSVYRWWGRACA